MNDFSSHKTLGLAHYLPLDLAFIMQQLWTEGWTGLDWTGLVCQGWPDFVARDLRSLVDARFGGTRLAVYAL